MEIEPETENFSETDDSSFDEDAFAWPEPIWSPPKPLEGWAFEADPPADTRQPLASQLNSPGFIILGLPPHDAEIKPNWLYKLAPERLADEAALVLQMHLDEENVLYEGDLCAEIFRLHGEKVSEAGLNTDEMPMLALVDCHRFSPSPTERIQNLSRLERRKITLVLAMGSDELGKFAHKNVTAFDLDTTEIAFRRIVKTIAKDERSDVLDPRLRELHEGLSGASETLRSIRADVKQRNDFREKLQAKIEASSDQGDALALCREAIDEVTLQASASNALISKILGLQLESRTGKLLSIEELAEQTALQEPYATAVFLFWAWHGVRPDGVRDHDFKLIFENHLMQMKAEEEARADAIIKKAKRDGVKRKKALAKHKTPATLLLSMGPAMLDKVIDSIGADSTHRHGVRYIGYSRQTQDVLRAQLQKVPSYVKAQIQRLEYWLDPIFRKEQSLNDLGRFLFIHTAEQQGNVDTGACRELVEHRILQWVELFGDSRMNLNSDDEKFEAFLKQYSDQFPPEVIMAAQALKVGQRNKRLWQKVVSLVGGWFQVSVRDEPENPEKIVQQFSLLVTGILRTLLHKDHNGACLSLFRVFLERRPELVDIKSVFRMVTNEEPATYIAEIIARLETDSYRIGRLGAQGAAYRFIAEELANEQRLADRSWTEQWAVSSLAMRILPGIIQRLQQADYQPTEDLVFSSDAVLAQIFGEEHGIETFVDTVMNDRVRLYPQEAKDLASFLNEENRGITPQDIDGLLEQDFKTAAFHCETIWHRAAQHSDPQTPSAPKTSGDTEASVSVIQPSVDDGEGDENNTDTLATRTYSEIRELWWKTHKAGINEELRPQYIELTRMFSYTILQELHGMLICSGRDDMAARLLDRMKAKMPRGERGMPRQVVLNKSRVLAIARRRLSAHGANLRRSGQSTKEVDLWLSFMRTRVNVVKDFNL